MDVEYKKDLRHNYMVIAENENQKIDPYCIKMLKHQAVEGVLLMEQRQLDNRLLFYYDITAKQSMINFFDKAVLSYDRVASLFTKLLYTLEEAYEYLLPGEDFIISPDYIYMDVSTNKPYLCFVSGYAKSVKEQINTLLEYLMNKVDYNDKNAVLLVYQLYAVSREEGFTLEHLLEVLQKHTLDEHEIKSNQKGIPSINNMQEKEAKIESRQFREINLQNIDNPQKERGQQKYGFGQSNSIEQNSSFELNSRIKQINGFQQYSGSKQNSGSPQNNRIQQNNGIQQNSRSRKDNKIQLLEGIQQNYGNQQKDKSSKMNYPHQKNSSLQKERERFSHQTSVENKERKDNGMSVMMEKLEGEDEISCYPLKTYLYTVACAVVGAIFVTLTVASNILYNEFGNRINYSKLFALFLIFFCVEGYLLKKIWDKKNKITKLIQKKEYIDPREEPDAIGVHNRKPSSNVNNINIANIENIADKVPTMQYDYRINQPVKDDISPMKLKRMKLLEMHTDNTDHKTTESEEVDNPTCLLNESLEKTTLILKSLDELNYKTIHMIDFPFFIGKLKKNVDYCLEKDVVSRFHAKITKELEQYYITDLNSTNGTFVNEEALTTYQKKEIKIGDEIAFANIKYLFLERN